MRAKTSAWAFVLLALCAAMRVDAIMSDVDFYSAFNYSHPGLESLKSLVANKQYGEAASVVTKYYKTRHFNWYFNPLKVNKSEVSSDVRVANDAVEGKLCSVSICHQFPNGSDIGWFFNPTGGKSGFPYDPEWQWQLNRHAWWSNLGAAWWYTNNSVYAKTAAREIVSWEYECPRPIQSANQSDWSAWRTIEAGIRVSTSWPDTFNRFLTSPDFDDEVIVLFLKGFLDHAQYLHTFHTSGNWLTMEMNGLFTVGALFPEFSQSQIWRTYAASLLYETARVDFLPDGMWNELTTGYMQVSINNIAQLYDLAILTKTSNNLPNGFLELLKNAYLFNVKMMCPSGDLPLVNDAWENNVAAISRKGLSYFPNEPLLKWAASNRVSGLPPNFTSIHFNSSNYIVMRSGWGFTDNYALFDVAPLGARHDHQDKLNLIIDAFGRKVLYDGGGGPYEQSKFRNFAVDTPSHNTVLVDNLPQRRPGPTPEDPMGSGNPKTPKPVFETAEDHDYVVGYYMDNYGSSPLALHRREVYFNKLHDQFFVVVDTLTPNDAKTHSYQVLWNLLTTSFQRSGNPLYISTTDAEKPNLAVISLSLNETMATYVAYNTSGKLYGWDVDRSPPFQIPALEILQERVGEGKQVIATMLVPIKSGTKPTIEGVKKTAENISLTLNGNNILIQLGVDGGIKVKF